MAHVSDEAVAELTPPAGKKRMGRPPKNFADLRPRRTVSMRLRQPIYDQVLAAAVANGRSMSEEMEARVEAAFAQPSLVDAIVARLDQRSGRRTSPEPEYWIVNDATAVVQRKDMLERLIVVLENYNDGNFRRGGLEDAWVSDVIRQSRDQIATLTGIMVKRAA